LPAIDFTHATIPENPKLCPSLFGNSLPVHWAEERVNKNIDVSVLMCKEIFLLTRGGTVQ
jgi:hypothetical protein